VLVVAPKDIYFAEFISQFENCFRVESEEEIYNAFKKIIDEQIEKLGEDVNADRFSRRHQNKRFQALVEKYLDSGRSKE
jgi:hypothetical protein